MHLHKLAMLVVVVSVVVLIQIPSAIAGMMDKFYCSTPIGTKIQSMLERISVDYNDGIVAYLPKGYTDADFDFYKFYFGNIKGAYLSSFNCEYVEKYDATFGEISFLVFSYRSNSGSAKFPVPTLVDGKLRVGMLQRETIGAIKSRILLR
ncbi:MAG: hypothetical protein FD119_2604 [Stygiobacter sp.]|nr:MAG: hypothetical protein FD119_2604 [Stygiobacter sp.]